MAVFDTLLRRYEFWIVTALVLASILQRFLGPEHDFVQAHRGWILRRLNPVLSLLGRPTIRVKGNRDYICTVALGEEQTEKAVSPPYHRNLIATKKGRTDDHGKIQWANGSWVYKRTPTADQQHHIYLFSGDDSTDIYGHLEPNIVNAKEHHGGGDIIHGDPDEFLRSVLDSENIEYSEDGPNL